MLFVLCGWSLILYNITLCLAHAHEAHNHNNIKRTHVDASVDNLVLYLLNEPDVGLHRRNGERQII
jgi:hypothetical protein